MIARPWCDRDGRTSLFFPLGFQRFDIGARRQRRTTPTPNLLGRGMILNLSCDPHARTAEAVAQIGGVDSPCYKKDSLFITHVGRI
jgi:hypothetical protein